MQESPIESSCPVCGDENSLKMIAHSTQIAYFGEHTQITLSCSTCGFRQTDFIPAEGKIPGVWTLEISSVDDLNARVVRGSNCTVEISELDLAVYPGIHSSGYVSNVEGVINRFVDAINITKNQLNPEEKSDLEKCNSLLDNISNMVGGKTPIKLTLIFSDPMGHSKILHENAIFRELSEKEVEDLL
ncbi:MAG: hypothetical protein CMA34_05385 [Euryarchaeota archaeon]|nr:hypothetical protein [Euryarchaeota archaeon]